MIKIMKYGEVDNKDIFARGTAATSVEDIVTGIIENVRANGDKALYEYCERFDKVKLSSLEVSQDEIKYKKFTYQDGPIFSIDIDEVVTVAYENGEVEVYDEETIEEKNEIMAMKVSQLGLKPGESPKEEITETEEVEKHEKNCILTAFFSKFAYEWANKY